MRFILSNIDRFIEKKSEETTIEKMEEAREAGKMDDIRNSKYGLAENYTTIYGSASEFPPAGVEGSIYYASDEGKNYKWVVADNSYAPMIEEDWNNYIPRIGIKDIQYVAQDTGIEYVWISEGEVGGKWEQVNETMSVVDVEELFKTTP